MTTEMSFPVTLKLKTCALLWIFVVLIGACGSITDPEPKYFDGERAFRLVEKQMEFGTRIPGTEGHRETGDWIIDELNDLEWEVEEQKFTYKGILGRNIIAKNGLEDGEWIILGAHYDTRPKANRDPDHYDEPVPGANDGASGVAVLLDLARVLPPLIDQPLWLVFFDVEDSGGIDDMEWVAGSTYFVETLVKYPEAVVVIDMVGDSDLGIYFENNSDFDLSHQIWTIAEELGYESFIRLPKYTIIDDHVPFIRRGIPAVDIIDFDYAYWHTTEDTLDKVSAESLEQVGRTLQEWLTAR
ncbi:MAG: M28 family peptidase [Anaerolineales bacterium]|nr:M28 family peptidase [Anaerolineales bacterium]